jgi:beta-glucosidase
MQVAQAWDPALFETWGAAMGVEQAAKGSNVMLGPAVALVRVPYSGRNFEYYSEDPFFNAALAGAMVRGIQSNALSACVKHWIFNSQVSGRGVRPLDPLALADRPLFSAQETNRSGMSANVAERVGRELYGPPYAAAVDAGVGSVMCSFNRERGGVEPEEEAQPVTSPCPLPLPALCPCHVHPQASTRRGAVRTQTHRSRGSSPTVRAAGCGSLLSAPTPLAPSSADGFDGFTVSDWGATHGTIDFALGGLDMEQEWVKNATFYGASLTAAVANGSVPEARLDDMARRILTSMYVSSCMPLVPLLPCAPH